VLRALGAFITALHEAVLGLSGIPKEAKRNMKIRERQQRKRNGKRSETQWFYLVKLSQERLEALGAKANIESVNLLGEAESRKATFKDFSFTRKVRVVLVYCQ
jgi:hypothetical protein